MKIEVLGNLLTVHSFGAQSVFDFGICNEIKVVEKSNSLYSSFDYTCLLVIAEKYFYFDQKSGEIREEGTSTTFSVNESDLPDGDEPKIKALFDQIGVTASSENIGQFYVITFGNEPGKVDCTSCWTDRGCALTFCGSKCDWADGCSY